MPSIDNPAEELKRFLAKLMPSENIYRPMVKKETQLEVLEKLNENIIANESFYLVFNLITGEFDHVNGVEKWLGYPDDHFTLSRYLNAIYPGQVVLHNTIAQSMYKTLCSGIFKLQFSRQRFISQIGLKHYNGSYIGFKKTTSIFQYDDKNRLMAQLNEFTKIDVYENGPLKTRITEMDGLQKDDFERMVFQMAIKTFMEKKYFSETEFKILKAYAEKELISTKQLAEKLDIAVLTADTFNKRILVKARKTFTHPFNNAREVALYLKKEKIL